MSIYTASVPTYRGYTFPLWSIILGWCLAFSSVSAIPIIAAWHWWSQRDLDAIGPGKSSRKRGERGSSSASGTSSKHLSRKSPNHKALAVRCVDQSQGGLKTTTTALATSPHLHQLTPLDVHSKRTGEDML